MRDQASWRGGSWDKAEENLEMYIVAFVVDMMEGSCPVKQTILDITYPSQISCFVWL